MDKKCSKCGAETDYGDDLHCRKIFIDEVKRFLTEEDFKKITDLYSSSPLDEEWKEYFLYNKCGDKGKEILWEIQQARAEVSHKRFITSLGLRYGGSSAVSPTKKHRSTHCYNCKASLDNSVDIECNICKWIICTCGACGCGYNIGII